MSCICSEMPITIRGNTSASPFKDMEEIETKSARWIQLLRCKECGQYWQVDGWDKYQIGLAIKVTDPDNWTDFHDLPNRMDHLRKSRGGTVNGICAWKGCDDNRLKGLAYCARHAYEISGLRE